MKRVITGACVVLACLATSALAPPPAAANLLANPGFETGGGSYAGWFTFGSGVQLSLPAGDNIIHTGAAASKIFGGFVGCPGTGSFNVGGYGQAFTPAPGSVYEFSGYSFVSSADTIPGDDTCNRNRCLAKVVFFNQAVGGAEIASNEVIVGDGHTPLDQWLPFSVSAPVPAGAMRVEALILYLQPACDGGAVFLDDLSFTSTPENPPANALVNPSFSSGLTGWSTFGNVYPEARSFAVRTAGGSAKLFSTFTLGSDSGLFQSLAASAGQLWRLHAYAMTTCMESPITGTNDNFSTAVIIFRDAQGVQLGSTETVIANSASPLGTWTLHTVEATAPAGTAWADAYVLFISPTLMGGAIWVDDLAFSIVDPTGVEPQPRAAELRPGVPNPFTTETRIDFALPQRERVQIAVYDVAGRRVATLVDGALDAGPHSVTWNGRTAAGAAAGAGVYRCVLTTPAGRVSRSLLLVK